MKNNALIIETELSSELQALLSGAKKAPETKRKKTRSKQYNPETDKEFVAGFLKMQFVQELRGVMELSNVNNSELARRTGKSRQAVSKALNRMDPDNFSIEKMAELVCAIGARMGIWVRLPEAATANLPVEGTWPATIVDFSAMRKADEKEYQEADAFEPAELETDYGYPTTG